ncbi:hypothetical protein HA402_006121 [Bradysia odoriphaga]|nr:hypothetical protein HA402_006121 [Bradysia odoriphaga]
MTNTTGDTFYEILNCDRTASTDEIKKSYQTLILKHHPDKQEQNSKSEVFVRLNEAWHILRDPDKRRAYDAEILQKQFSENRIVHEVVNLDMDFQFDPESNSYCRDCRCGAQFVVFKEDIDKDDSYLECDECSLVIGVTL